MPLLSLVIWLPILFGVAVNAAGVYWAYNL